VHPTRRALTPDDLADVVGLVEACDLAVIGYRDFTEDDLAADLKRDDLEAYGWYDGQGTLVGYGWVARVEATSKVEVDVYVRPGHDDALGPAVLAEMEQRGLELVAEAGHDEAVLDIGVYRKDERTRAWLVERGFAAGTLFVRMRIDLDGPYPVPDPAPLVIRRVDGSEDDLRTAHRVSEDSFVEHYGHVPTSFGTWRLRLTEQGPQWAEVWLAELDGAAVGVLVGTEQFAADDNAGYVRTLGTLPTARGKGAGKALLKAYFAASHAAGREAVLLHVDVANVTEALRLYESVGMRPVLEIDAWAKRAPVG
jgi:ribosomal protein S18 acetylase RimI-like enzyme